jgi:calcium-dependent protein kinase
MYLLLTTRYPFFGDNNKEKMESILHKKYKTKYLEKFSENTKDLLSKLLEKEPKQRINAETAINHKFFDEFKVKDLLTEIKDVNIIDKMIENLKNYKRKSILQELTIAYLIHNYPDLEEYTNACKLFDKIDVNNNGKISLDELYIGLSIIKGDKIKDTDVLEIFANLDIEKNNYLSYEDFVRGAIDKNCLLNDKILSFAFKYFDKDDKGVITINEISYIFKDHLAIKDVNEGLKKIISEVDEDNDGKITYNEFCKLMRSLII